MFGAGRDARRIMVTSLRQRPAMTTRYLLQFSLLILLSFSLTAATADDDARTALEQRQGALIDALQALDAERVSAFFAEDAQVHVANMPPLRGREAIGGMFARVYRFMESAEYQAESLTVGGDLAFSTGSVTTTFPGESGAAVFTGKFSLVWRLSDGQWQVVFYAISNNQSGPLERPPASAD